MIRRHFFLAGALVVLALVIVAGALKIVLGPHGGSGGGQGGPPAAQGGGGRPEARGPGGPSGGGPGGPGGGRRGGAPQVTIIAAESRTFSDRIDVLGVAKGRQSVTLSAPTQQLVSRVLFRPGQYVRRGQVLLELQASEQDANLMSSRARVAQAQRDYERWNELARRGVAPQATADQYQAALATARADYAAAMARRSDRVVRAPFSGRLGLSDVAPGALLNPGSPIVTLDDISTIRVDFEVPDRYLAAVHPGDPIIARVDAYPGLRAEGHIALLDSRIDERTRALTARAEFPNPGGQFLPGMLMRVGVVQAERTGVAVPETAIQYDGDNAFVFAVQRGERGLRAIRRPVTIGVNQDGFVEIRTGLEVGDRIAADGLNRLQDGQPVIPAGMGPPGGGDGGPGGRPGGPRSGAQGGPPGRAAG